MSTWELTITPASPDGLPLFLRMRGAARGQCSALGCGWGVAGGEEKGERRREEQ